MTNCSFIGSYYAINIPYFEAIALWNSNPRFLR